MPYVHERRQFGEPIGSFQLMQGKLADMYTDHERQQGLRLCGGQGLRPGRDATRKDAAGAVLFASEKATWMALEAIQALGWQWLHQRISDRAACCATPSSTRSAVNDFQGIETSAFWDDLKFSLRHLNDFSKCAVVSDKQWVNLWSALIEPFIECEVEHFDLERDSSRPAPGSPGRKARPTCERTSVLGT